PGFEIKYVTESHEPGLNKLPFGRILVFLLKAFIQEGTTTQVKHYVCSNCRTEFDEIPA
ncbi:MAG: hypothetical protein JWM28_4242, partial [Chitinophagaceae bacterium]|nr:hypothetical protein [Chitinophagaceae bacterium]